MDAPHQPDFSAVRLNDRERWRILPTIPPAGIRYANGISAPNDHFTAGPDCRMIRSGSGRVGGAGGSPTIRAGIVSPAGVDKVSAGDDTTPDDHFTAGPDVPVNVPGRRRGRCARASPTIR